MENVKKKAVIEKKALDALKALRNVRKKNPEHKWIDDSKVGEEKTEGPGFIKTCEALECFFTPLDVYPDPLKEEYKLDADILKEDLDYIMDTIDSEGWPPSPYFDPKLFSEEGKFQKGKTDFTDAVSFALTTLIDAYLYINRFYEDDPTFNEAFKEKLLKYAKDSLQWLVENVYSEKSDGKEYAYYSALESKNYPIEKNNNYASIYFTYTGAVALAYAVKYKKELNLSKEEIDNIVSILNKLRDWLFSTADFIKGSFIVYYRDFSANENFDKPQLLFIYIILTDSAFKDADLKSPNDDEYSKKIVNMVKVLNSIYSITDERTNVINGGEHKISQLKPTSTKSPLYTDRYLNFLMLEAFVYAFREIQEIGAEKDFLQNIFRTIDELHKDLLERANASFQLPDGSKVDGLWGQERVFTIYLNERAIESLTEYSSFNKNIENRRYFALGNLEEEDFRDMISQGVKTALELPSIQNQIVDEILAKFSRFEKLREKGELDEKEQKKIAEEAAARASGNVNGSIKKEVK